MRGMWLGGLFHAVRGAGRDTWVRLRRYRLRMLRRTAALAALLLVSPLLMGSAVPGGHTPMPSAAGIRGTVVALADWVTGKAPAKPVLPQAPGAPAPGPRKPVPASVTRNDARAEGYKPGIVKGAVPAYTFPVAKVTPHVTGPADLGTAASFSPVTSTLVASRSTATSKLYKNADGSYTRLESPRQATAGTGALTFAAISGTGAVGVKGAHVTSVALRVNESWAGGCPSSATVSVTDAAGQRVGNWSGRPSAAACGKGTSGWVTVPLDGAGVKALSATGGAALTVTATPAVSKAPRATPAPSPASGAVPASGTTSTASADAVVLAVTAAASTPSQVNSVWPPDGYNAPSLTPELIASGQSGDGTAPMYQFSVYSSSGTWIDASKYQPADDWVVPAGDLAWGKTYYWTVQVFDSSSADPSPVSPRYALTTQVPQPVISSNLAQDGTGQGNGATSTGPGYDAQNGNYTTTATDATITTAGPALSVQRTYNSLNASASGAFGTGWTSVFDMNIRPGRLNSDGSAATLVVTYPDGEQVAFGVNPGTSPQTWTSPQGRFGTIAVPPSGGYELVDKNNTTYVMSHSLGSNVYGVTSVYDGQNHYLNFTWNSSNEVTQVKSAVSGRYLNLTWFNPSGAYYPHVQTVATNPVTSGTASSAITWQYNYSGDHLTSACNESETGTPCTSYAYAPWTSSTASGSDYPAAVLDSGPNSYWRLDETSGTAAASSVLANEGADNGTYVNPEFSFASNPLAGEPSSVQTVGFNGTSSYVQLPASLGNDGAVRSVSLRFDTNGGKNQVLMEQSTDPVTASSSSSPYTPIMYIGNDGLLEAGFGGTPLHSTKVVNDYNPHTAVLTSNGTTETLYIDGAQVASQSQTVAPVTEPYLSLGAGFLGGTDPDEADSGSTPVATHFAGAMADVATWDRALTAAEVTTQYTAASNSAALLSQTKTPLGHQFQAATYNAQTSALATLTDSNGGTWTLGTPAVSGTSQGYVTAVKGAQPLDYWRLADTSGTTALNQVGHGGTATYSNVTLGVAGGSPSSSSANYPFPDTTVTSFNGTNSYVALPGNLVRAGNESVSLWFKTTATDTDTVLFSSSADSPANGNTPNGFTPNLYIDQNGYLEGEFDDDDSPLSNIPPAGTTATAYQQPVNNGKWHNVVLTSDNSTEYLYLDGVQVGSATGETMVGGTAEGQDQAFVGTGFLGSDWANQAHYSTTDPTGYPSYFTGDIAEVAVYPHQVSGGDVAAQWAAAQDAQGLSPNGTPANPQSSGWSPVETVKVTDPSDGSVTGSGGSLTYQFDPVNNGRELTYTDGTGATSTYGYDAAGFQSQVIDPNGNFTDQAYDTRGNVLETTTCQGQATFKCGTSYESYTPPAQIGAWGTQDEVQYIRDPRSSSQTDNTYLTTNNYDSLGDLVTSEAPSAPGATTTAQRTTTNSYTDGTTASKGGWTDSSGTTETPPAGLLYKAVSPNGATTYNYYDSLGDLRKTINPDGVITDYAYDGIGRKTAQAVTSDTYSGLTTSYTYDADNQVIEEIDPGVGDRVTGATHQADITTTYDADGNKTQQVTKDVGSPTADQDPTRTLKWTYNTLDQMSKYVDGANAETDYAYDAYGNKKSQTVDPSGSDAVTTDYIHDTDGRLLTTTLANYTGSPLKPQTAASLTEETRVYDLGGRLSSVTDALGNVTEYSYTDNGLTAEVTKTMTAAAAKADGLSTIPVYIQEQDTYDPAGNLTAKVTNNKATTTDYVVDAKNRVTSQTVDPNGTLDRVTAYTYDPDDHVKVQAVSQGSSSPIQTTAYTYDAMGNKTSQAITDPTAAGPTGWWGLANNSGTTVADESKTGNTATATSGVTWSSTGAQFSGASGQDIITRGPVVDTTGSYSVSAWVNMATVNDNYQTVVSQDAQQESGFYLGYDPSAGWSMELPVADNGNADDATAADSTAPTAGAWTFLTGTYDASSGTITLYVNGTKVGTATDTTPIPASGPVEIGSDKGYGQTGGDNFDGTINNVEMYPFAMSQSEITNLYQQGGGSGGNGTSSGEIERGALTTTYQLDQLGQDVAQTSPDGITTQYEYDQAGHKSHVIEPMTDVADAKNGFVPTASVANTYTGYDLYGDVADTQDENGNDTYYTYDGDGRQTSETLPPDTVGGTTFSDSTTYNNLGEVQAKKDFDQNETDYTYDQLGHQTSAKDVGTGGVTQSAYDPNGKLLEQVSPTGAQTGSTWDFLGRQVTSSDVERYLSTGSAQSSTPATYTTTTSYAATTADPSGTWKSSVTTPAPESAVTDYGYDAAGEETSSTQVTSSGNNTTSYAYDALGRKIRVTNPDQTYQTTTYDPAGDVTATTNYDSSNKLLSVTSSTFNGEGKQLSATDADGNTSTFTYDAAGNLTAETQPVTSAKGIVTSFAYDPAGNQTRYTDGNRSNWTTTYNGRNLPATKVEPSTSQYTATADITTTMSYDGNGNLLTETDPGNVTLTYSYDSLGDVRTQTGSGATATTATRTFTYNTDGSMHTAATSSTASSGSNATSETFTYNDRGDVNSATGSAGSTSLLYNGDDHLQTATTPAGTSNYTYDNAGRLATQTDPATGGTSLTYSYNQLSQPQTITYGSSGDTQTYGYNTLHQLTSDTVTHGTGSSATTIASIGYTPDNNGNLTKKTTSYTVGTTTTSATNTYTYDQANRLTSWNNGSTTTAYAYDGNSNRTQAGSTTYTYDARDELTSDGTSTYAYSANGDLTSVTAGSTVTKSTSDAYGQQGTSGTQSSTYDALGRDVAVTTGSTTTSLSYLAKTGQLTSDGTSTYTWSPSGTLTGTAPSGSTSGNEDLTDQHTDVVGQFTPSATGLTGSQTYGPWGNVTATAGTLQGSLGYQSQYTSPVTGQTDMGARWYNPANGDFANKDTVSNKPVPNSASASPYGYAAANPLTNTDPSGHMILEDPDTVSTTAAAAQLAAAQTAAATASTNNGDNGLTLTPPSGVDAQTTASILHSQITLENAATAKPKTNPAPPKPPVCVKGSEVFISALSDPFKCSLSILRSSGINTKARDQAAANYVVAVIYNAIATGAADTPASKAPGSKGENVCSVAVRFGPCQVDTPGPDAPGGSLGFLAGLGQDFVDLLQLALCGGHPQLPFSGGGLPECQPTISNDYQKWLASQGIDTSPSSTFGGGEGAGDVLMAGLGGLLGEAGAGAGTADEASALEREAQMAGMLREAAIKKGFFGMGSGTQEEAMLMGEAWVGPGYKVASDGKTMISADGLRQFRPPSFKPNLPVQYGGPGYQANFEWRLQAKGQWFSDGHLNITDIP